MITWIHILNLYLFVYWLSKCSTAVFFFQYNLAIQLFMYNSAFLITKKNSLKLQQDPGYFVVPFNKQLRLSANGLAPCKQVLGPCSSPLSKAHGGLPTCDTAVNEGTCTDLNIYDFMSAQWPLVSGLHRISWPFTDTEIQPTADTTENYL